MTAKNAVAAIRVSTAKQGTDGDSPEAQKEQIERFAQNKGITIKKFFVFLESASKEQQPIQEAIDYCKQPGNKVDLFIIKSIDRFTRGGSDAYNPLKQQLDQVNVSLVDIYGVISDKKVNTLDHLGVEYKWSVYSPSKKSEILEAERGKDELRDIMSRMIGAEVRYTRMGYWMRQAPFGYKSERLETKNGKRTILVPHDTEAPLIKKMFKLRSEGIKDDEQIVAALNKLGFRTRVRYTRDKHDRTRIISQKGGDPLTAKAMHKMLKNPIYAGINTEKWTEGKPVKCVFDGLVTLRTFNKANNGKIFIGKDEVGDYQIRKEAPPVHLANKNLNNPEFAYKRYVLCPECSKPLLGSASRGKSGKYYPAYHCSKQGHYFRVPKADMEEVIKAFIKRVQVSDEHIGKIFTIIEAEFKAREQEADQDLELLQGRISALETEAKLIVDKMKMLTSETAIKYMEEDLLKVEQQIKDIEDEISKRNSAEKPKIETVLKRVRYFMEHLDELLLQQSNPIQKAQFFGAIFDKLPTYEDLKGGTQKTPLFPGVNMLFKLLHEDNVRMVIPTGVEPVFLG